MTFLLHSWVHYRTALVLPFLLAASLAWAQSTPPASTATNAPEAASRAIPTELSAFASSRPWQMRGTGQLRFFGFKAYDATLWSMQTGRSNPLLGSETFALEIAYAASVTGEEISRVSLVEMSRLRSVSPERVQTWNAQLLKAFPSVKSGDRLTGVMIPRQGVRFFFNGRLTAEVNDPEFAEAFFAIWLDEKTRRPELRKALLGS